MPKTKPPWQEMVDDLNLHDYPIAEEQPEGMGSASGDFTNPWNATCRREWRAILKKRDTKTWWVRKRFKG